MQPHIEITVELSSARIFRHQRNMSCSRENVLVTNLNSHELK